jgi:TolB-like protein
MIYTFGQFELDLAAAELRAGGAVVHVEPQVFSLLALLVENSERLISRDEIIEKVWDGRIVSDAAIASRVKSARQALGDDGRAQQLIKTLHGQGYRFVGQARAVQSVAVVSAAKAEGLREMTNRPERMLRPSLAVLPFRFIGNDERYAPLASALPDELIADLARLRWLLVTARGSSFRLRAPEADFGDIGRLLNVRYCLWGTLETSADRLAVMVNLVDTENGSVVWAERFAGRVDDVHAMREQIRSQVLMALEIRIPMHEAGIARLSAVENLDAWSAYHLGLQHLYRFNRCDNDVAADLFRRAVVLEPTFARAHAGLSFVNFQAAFMQYTPDPCRRRRPGPALRRARAGARSARSVRQLHHGSHVLARGQSGNQPRAGSSVRPTSARTLPRESTRAPGPKRWRDRRAKPASTSIWRCA